MTVQENVDTDQPDIRTSQLAARRVMDGDTMRLYPAVCHDASIDDKQARSSSGKAFGRTFTSEALSVSEDFATMLLMPLYGTEAHSMLIAARKGGYVYGEKKIVEADGYKHKMSMNVATDKSRDDGYYVVQVTSLRQGKGGK